MVIRAGGVLMDVEVWRERNALRMNKLLNMPEIRPWVGGLDGPLDVSAIVANPLNHLLMGEHGGVLFGCIEHGIYECHTVVHPAARGRWTSGMTQACVHHMFTKTDCYEIATRIPQGHMAAMAAAVGVGMRMEFTIPDGVVFKGERRPVHILSFRIQDWLPNAPGLERRGEWFHRCLDAEAARLGVQAPPHEDMPVHNKVVGACVDMAFSGQLRKGVLLYNRASRLMRHSTVEYVDFDRIKMDIGTLVFGSDGCLEVVP